MMMGLRRRPWLLLLSLLVTVAVALAAASEGDADPLYQYAPLSAPDTLLLFLRLCSFVSAQRQLVSW
jgi:hypothetical protein